jgi:hypothetical protein
MAISVPVTRPVVTGNPIEQASCECDRGVLYEHRCCGELTKDGSCCMNPEWAVRECDRCGGDVR